jgi:hypothetical protein
LRFSRLEYEEYRILGFQAVWLYVFLCIGLAFLLLANDVPISLNIFTLMLEAIFSSETSVLKRATLRIIPEDDILHSHRRGNLKSKFTSQLSAISNSCNIDNAQCRERLVMHTTVCKGQGLSDPTETGGHEGRHENLLLFEI